MLMPKKVKYRKQQRGRMAGKAWRGADVSFGDYGLKAMEPCWLTDRQIEAARVAMTRSVKRGGKIWVRVFPDKPITKKPQETRMGKGKGAPEEWVCVVRPGKILFEMEGVPLPLPMRVSWGFLVIGLSGNTRTQILPPRLIARVIATRAASICRAVIQHGSIARSPKSPKATVDPRHALPVIRPRCCFLYLTFFGINMTAYLAPGRSPRGRSRSSRRIGAR